MKNKNTAKIIGGFLAGAGVITYLLATEKGKKITKNAGCEAKKIMHDAEEKASEKASDIKEGANSFADQIMAFIVDNRPMVENAVSSIVNTLIKKK